MLMTLVNTQSEGSVPIDSCHGKAACIRHISADGSAICDIDSLFGREK